MDLDDDNELPDSTDLMILPWVSLFPGALLPLYIFEERYRKMTRSALAGNRLFAIAHTYDDTTIAPIGGLGIIRACITKEDGTSNLVLQGLSRVEFTRFQNTPRPHADIRVLRDESQTGSFSEIRSRILHSCEELLAEGGQIPDGFREHLHSGITDSGFADLVASTLVEDPIQRRTLFETIELKARMSLLLEILGTAAESA